MGPETFSGDNIFEAVAVDIDQFDGMQLGEGEAVTVFGGVLVHEDMAFDLWVSVGVFFFQLFEPAEAISMAGDTRDDVVESITVHVVGKHLRAAAGAENGGATRPDRIALDVLGLFPPCATFEKIDLAVGVHIADAQSVIEVAPRTFCADGSEWPFGGNVTPIG